ncbi:MULTISPECIES: FliM/FliN family flagellar motor switch protein [unclassified Yoonia]|uniref:FliM/FliN family flagellar motor switch protein n=1 Tax=unclassified Yoonia TaxID=2629118 RepID=UPI002B002447|nr:MULTISPECIES: FliM/FliN family flagellar motor switch protein [unclassified Yoonia]
MTDSSHISILRRMAGQAVGTPPVSPLTTSRAVRLALVKAATDPAGLVLRVASTADDVGRLDDLLGGLDAGLMLVGLDRQGQLVGFVAIDTQLRAAVVEVQTTGRLIDQAADDRPATGTDKALCDPLLAAFLTALPPAVTGTAYEGWVDGVTPGDRLADSRLAGLLLADGDYRVLRMTVELGTGDRRGEVMLALPVQAVAPAPEAPAPAVDWDTAFTAAVQDAPASLTARLHRFKMPLGQAQSLQVGQVVPLPGCTVNSVRLIAPDGRCVAQAKLGQLAGHRAVRIELAPGKDMDDLLGSSLALPEVAFSFGDTGENEILEGV